MNWKVDKDWSDRFIRPLKQIAGLYTIGIGDDVQDREEGTDLIVLEANPCRIACRVRRPDFYPRFQFDITIRSKRDSGIETEFVKMMREDRDWAFLYLYCFSKENGGIVAYHAIRIPALRNWIWDLIQQDSLPKEINNGDGTWFRPFDIRRMPVECIIHSTVREGA